MKGIAPFIVEWPMAVGRPCRPFFTTEGDASVARNAAATNRRSAHDGWQRITDAVVLAGLLLFIFATPYFRGLFFPKEQMVGLLLLLGLFVARWAVKFARGDYDFVRSPLDWAALAVVAAYFLSTLVAANQRLAVQEDIKYLMYFIAFWLARELAGPAQRRQLTLAAVAGAGIWLSVLGVGAAAGTFHYNGAFDGLRIYSALQYPNTLAAYLTAAFFCGLALWLSTAARGGAGLAAAWRAWPAHLWGIGLYAILFVFLFSYSRGGWLVFPPVMLLFLNALPRADRPGAVLATAAAALPLALVATPFGQAVAAKSASGAWTAFLMGVPLAAVLSVAALGLAGLLRGTGLPNRSGAAAGVVAGGSLLALAALAVVLGPRILPQSLLERLRSINLTDNYEALSRLAWARDGLQIVKDHPILGAGGGAWETLYHQYQSYGYWSTQVHNHFIQLWMETGTLGFTAFLALWAFLLWRGFTIWRRQPSPFAAGPLAGALALGAHSLIDFNLSLSAVSIALWSLVGAVEAGAREPQTLGNATGGAAGAAAKSANVEYRFLPRLAVYGGGTMAALGVLMLLAGFAAGQRGAAALNAGRGEEAQRLFQEAVKYDPLTASYHVDLGQTYAVQASAKQDRGLMAEAGRAFAAGLARDPNNPNLKALYGSYLLQTGQIQEGLAAMEEALKFHQYEAQRYEQLAGAYLAVAKGLLTQDRLPPDVSPKDARQYVDKALALRPKLKDLSASVPKWVVDSLRTPADTPNLRAFWGVAEVMKGQYKEGEADLQSAFQAGVHPSMKAEVQIWLAESQRAQGKMNEARASLAAARQGGPEAQQAEGLVARVLPKLPVR